LPERSFSSERTSRLQNTALYNPIQILNTEENQKAIQEAVLNSGLEQNSVKFGSVLSTGFARDGYEAVSVRAIAGKLGMTKGALYKHYKNKRDIFNSIVERMDQMDYERAKQYEVQEEIFEKMPQAYRLAIWKTYSVR